MRNAYHQFMKEKMEELRNQENGLTGREVLQLARAA